MYTHDDLVSGFRNIPLTPNSVIMVHSSYKSLGGVQGGADTVIDALEEYVGSDGTILFANFNFTEWTEKHYFDISETPSKMGILGEQARIRPDAIRTPHPIYSFVVLGKRKDEFASCDDIEAYGEDSVFALFHKLNGMIVSIGLHWNSTFSMHHYVEYNVGCDYRRLKRFSGVYIGYDGVPKLKTYTMNVRSNFDIITDIEEGMDDLFERGVIKATQVANATVHYATANDFFDNMSEIVKKNPEKLHKEKKRSF